MEKFGIDEDSITAGLRDEEHHLMLKMGQYMINMDKTADEENDYRRSQARLNDVRNALSDHDLKRTNQRTGL